MGIEEGERKMRRNIQVEYKNRNWRKYLGVICVLGLVLLSLVNVLETYHVKKKVSAHPANPISLGSGNSLFELPTDATRLTEDRLISDNEYNSYFQNDGFLLNPTKINVKGFSTVQPYQTIVATERTNLDRVLVVGRVGTWNTGVSYKFATTFLFLLNDENEILDSRQIDGDSINQTDGGYGTEVTFLRQLPDGSFNMLAKTNILNVSLNEDETRIREVTSTSMTFSNGTPPNEMGYNSVEIGSDDRIYYSGHWYERQETPAYLRDGRMIVILNQNGIEERRLRLKYAPCSDVFDSPNYMRISQLSGVNQGPNDESFVGLTTYTNSENQNYGKITIWDSSGEIVNEYAPVETINSIKPMNKISSIEERFFFLKSESSSRIIKYQASTGQFSIVIEFPGNTDMEIIELEDSTYNAVGYISDISGIFEPFKQSLVSNSAFTAHFSSDFELNTIVSINTGLEIDLDISSVSFIGGSKYFFGATFDEDDVSNISNTEFVDEVESILESNNHWTEKSPGAIQFNHNLFGILELQNDYKPAIKSQKGSVNNFV